jgi:hypothetical protein
LLALRSVINFGVYGFKRHRDKKLSGVVRFSFAASRRYCQFSQSQDAGETALPDDRANRQIGALT